MINLINLNVGQKSSRCSFATISFLCFVFVALGSLVFSSDTSAFRQTELVEGGDTGGVPADCYGQAYQLPCPSVFSGREYDWKKSGKYGGGASWRIFSVSGNAYGLDDYAGYGGGILNDRQKKETIKTCKAIGAKYFFSYGWDGMYNSVFGYPNFNFQIGPARRDNGSLIGQQGTVYNNYNNQTITKKITVTVKKKKVKKTVIDETKFKNNIKVSKDAALLAYQTYWSADAPVIPTWIGAFCSKESTEKNVFEGRARVSEGAWKTSTNHDDTGWVKSTDTASITIPKSHNEGEKTRYLLNLRSKGGTGTAKYLTSTSKLSNLTAKKLTSSIKLSGDTSGSHVLSYTYNNVTKNGDWGYVEPGETYCQYLYFIPKSGAKVKRVGACATASLTYFSGDVDVKNASNTKIASTGFGTGSTTVNKTIDGCNNGCKIEFSHYIYTTDNWGDTYYRVERTSSDTSRITAGGKIIDGHVTAPLLSKDVSKKVLFTDNLTLYPGMKVCEKLHFYNSNHYKSKKEAIRTVCVSVGKQTTGGGSTIDIKARNLGVDKYSEYQSEVYAKPQDSVGFFASYNPDVQNSCNGVPSWLQIDSGEPYENTSGAKLCDLFTSLRPSGYGWNNGFGVVGPVWNESITGQVGNSTQLQKESGDRYTISSTDVGSTITERAQTNNYANITTAPKQVDQYTDPGEDEESTEDDRSITRVITDSIGSDAYVKVPYNYINNISVTGFENGETSDDMSLFAAGEGGSAKIKVDVVPKVNDLTTNGGEDEAYTTKVDGAKLKIILFKPVDESQVEEVSRYGSGPNTDLCSRYSGECYARDMNHESILNKNGNLDGWSSDPGLTAGFAVPDVDAGTEYCVAAAVYPSDSGTNDNLSASGSNQWHISHAECFKVYKKPSVQVWGGNVFSAGKLSTPLAEKRHIKGITDYDIANKNPKAVFGSFTELGLTSVGEVRGFASGAANGYFSNTSNGVLTPLSAGRVPATDPAFPEVSPGGYSDNYACFHELSRLTFGNTSENKLECIDTVPGLGDDAQLSANTDTTSLVSTFVNMRDEEAEAKNIIVNKSITSDYTLSGYDYHVDKGQTKVIYAVSPDSNGGASNVYINWDIKYDTGPYKSLAEIPKMIIYAKNIYISCGVTEINAVLIADGDVDTCYDSDGDVDSQDRSNQLRINGSIIAGRLIAGRTYGAATSTNSIVPAEIIDYDTSLYLWGSKKADVTETGKLDTTYSRELAPKR